MKHLFCMPILLAATQLFAQEFKLDMNKVKKYVEQHKNRGGDVPALAQQKANITFKPKPAQDTADYSHTTMAGMVFILPQDNMPCLQPNKEELVYNMPMNRNKYVAGSALSPTSQMPNGYSVKPLILIKK